jgi:putative flippase GtrA
MPDVAVVIRLLPSTDHTSAYVAAVVAIVAAFIAAFTLNPACVRD